MLFGILNGLVARESQIANGSDRRELGGQCCHGGFEPHLVVAFAGAAVGHRVGAQLLGRLSEVLGDDGATECRHQRVALLVEGVGLERGHDEVVSKLVFGVDHHGLNGTAVEGALTDLIHVFAALAHVDGHGHDLFAGGIFEPTDTNRGVETTRVSKHNAFRHGLSLGRAARPHCRPASECG